MKTITQTEEAKKELKKALENYELSINALIGAFLEAERGISDEDRYFGAR